MAKKQSQQTEQAQTSQEAVTEQPQTAQDAVNDQPKVSKSKITPVKKLTVKAIYGVVLTKDIPDGDELKICRIAGTAISVVSGESTYGHFSGLAGEFASTNYVTGEIFVGKQAYVPGAMGEALIVGLEYAQAEDATASLRFSVDVSVKISSRDPNKYEYVVRPVIESDVGNQAVALLALSE
jgi:hypothetical protein